MPKCALQIEMIKVLGNIRLIQTRGDFFCSSSKSEYSSCSFALSFSLSRSFLMKFNRPLNSGCVHQSCHVFDLWQQHAYESKSAICCPAGSSWCAHVHACAPKLRLITGFFYETWLQRRMSSSKEEGSQLKWQISLLISRKSVWSEKRKV